MEVRLGRRFEVLAPVSSDYTTLPIAEAFNWADCADPEPSLLYFRLVGRLRDPGGRGNLSVS